METPAGDKRACDADSGACSDAGPADRARRRRAPPAGCWRRRVERHRAGQLGAGGGRSIAAILAAQAEHPDALHLLGLIGHARGDHAAGAGPDRARARRQRRTAAFHVAARRVLLALGRPEEAAAAARAALALDAGNAEAHNVLGNALLAPGRCRATRSQAYRRALTLRPGYAEALNNLGSALRAAGRLAEAEAALRQAVALRRPYPAALANLGLVLQEQGRYAEALAAFDRGGRRRSRIRHGARQPGDAAAAAGPARGGLRRLRVALAHAGFRHAAAPLPAAGVGRQPLWPAARCSCTPNRGWARRSSSCATPRWPRRRAVGSSSNASGRCCGCSRSRWSRPAGPVAALVVKGEDAAGRSTATRR